MNKFEYIPPEQMKERPAVFTEKSYQPVKIFTSRLPRLQVPINAEEVADYKEKYDNPATEIKPEEIQKLLSLNELNLMVDQQTGQLIKKELTEILTNDKLSEDKKEEIIEAVVNRSYENIDSDDKEMMTTALGLSLVAERARANVTAHLLENLPPETLERFNLTEKQRDLINNLMKVITKVNAEYLRHRVHINENIPYENLPLTDQLRERRFVAQGFQNIITFIQETTNSGQLLFGSKERDEKFLQYLTDLMNAYAPFIEGTSPLSAAEQREHLEKAQETFLSLHSTFPEFPFIVFPAFSHYETEEAARKDKEKGEKRDWRAYGFDPEIRLYWQSKEQRTKHQGYNQIKEKFVSIIEKKYANLTDTKSASSYQIIFADPLIATGINMQSPTSAQEEGNIILMSEKTPDAEEMKLHKIMESLIKDEDDKKIINSPEFLQYYGKISALHEFGHGLYPEKSQAADNLEDYDDQLAELKSELAMWSTAIEVLQEDAQKDFGDKAHRAVQLAMVKEALRYLKDEDDSAYFIAGQVIIKTLIDRDIIGEKAGKIQLKSQLLDQNLEPAFGKELAKILQIYQEAEQSNIELAKQKAQSIINQKPEKIIQKIKKMF